MNATDYIRALHLQPHPEGGYYRETYRSSEIIPAAALADRYQNSPRSISTAIYFMLTSESFSAFHRLQSDELWHFHAGDPISVHIIHRDGRHENVLVGVDVDCGQQLHVVFPAGSWFAARVESPGGFGLVGCTVAPGFDFADFELARRAELINLFPMHAELITSFTRS